MKQAHNEPMQRQAWIKHWQQRELANRSISEEWPMKMSLWGQAAAARCFAGAAVRTGGQGQH
jgi:hypothetical protein